MMKLALAAICLLLMASPALAHQSVDPQILKLIPDRPADEIKDPAGAIRRGRVLFGTPFGLKGNDRSCATCHEATLNFTIDREFIATLPPSSPLFIGERIPALAFLENPTFLREGLICENLDGFDMPCVFRGVPHTLGLRTSIRPDAGTATRPPFPLENATGWDGGGAPRRGAFVDFAMGAIVQHETGDAARIPGLSFIVPSKQQLRQMELFQLSLGQQAEINLAAIVFADATVEAGKALFVGGAPGRSGTIRSCNSCHNNAGANDSAGNNRQFNTGVARHPNAPACRGPAPGDGGFGTVPISAATICGGTVTATFRGNGMFNTPTLINAADTGPWFHNSIIDGQIEDAIRLFYMSDTFNDSPSGGGNGFVFTEAQILQLGALLRTVNAMENVRNARKVIGEAARDNSPVAKALAHEGEAEVSDALRVLRQAPVALYGGTNIIPLLEQASTLILLSINQNGGTRKATLQATLARLQRAAPQFTR